MRISKKFLIGLSLILSSACAPDFGHAPLQNRVKADLATLKSATDLYFYAEGDYPESLNDLVATNSKGPYLDKQRVDPWNRDYVYLKPGPDGKPFDILSYGEDGKPGGSEADKDLSVWD